MSSDERDIEVIRPGAPHFQDTAISPLATSISEMVNSLMNRGGLSMASLPRDIDYEDLDDSSRRIVDAFMEQLRPEIEEKAKALLTAEIRDRIVRKGNIADIGKALRKGKKLHLKRKKGCIFAQFGSGEPEDEIEEVLLAST